MINTTLLEKESKLSEREKRVFNELTNFIKKNISLFHKINDYGFYEKIPDTPNYEGRCPIPATAHIDPECRGKLIINSEKEIFYCHTCLRGGDIIIFTMLMYDLSLQASINQLILDYVKDNVIKIGD